MARYLRGVKPFQQLRHALLSYFRLGWSKGYTVGALLLMAIGMVYITYLCIPRIEPVVWIAVYWIAFLFLGIHTSLNSFAKESTRRFLYYYTLMPPELLFLSKCLYNSIVTFILGIFILLAMITVHGNPLENTWMFILVVLMGAVCLTTAFTFISAVVIKSEQSATLMTVAAFPVVIPALLIVVRLSLSSLITGGAEDLTGSLMILVALIMLVAGLGILLFPYLWRS